MGKKILILTDFSRNSWNTIQYAIKLYENQDCNFYLLNIYVRDSYEKSSAALLDPDDTFNKFAERRSQQGLGDILKLLSQTENNINHRFYVLSRFTPFLEAIREVVELEDIDMLIMGAKGMTNNDEGKYGKNTHNVIQNIRICPIMIIPENAAYDRPKQIVLATNFKLDFEFVDIENLVEIARISGANIQVVGLLENEVLSTKQERNKDLLCGHLDSVPHNFHLLQNIKMATALNCFVEINRSNMISYIEKAPSFWKKWGLGMSSLGKLGYFKELPVLALRGE